MNLTSQEFYSCEQIIWLCKISGRICHQLRILYPEYNENSLSRPKSHSLTCSVYFCIEMILFRTKLYIVAHTLPCSTFVNRKVASIEKGQWFNIHVPSSSTTTQHSQPLQSGPCAALRLSASGTTQQCRAPHYLHAARKDLSHALVYQLHDMFNCWLQNKLEVRA